METIHFPSGQAAQGASVILAVMALHLTIRSLLIYYHFCQFCIYRVKTFGAFLVVRGGVAGRLPAIR